MTTIVENPTAETQTEEIPPEVTPPVEEPEGTEEVQSLSDKEFDALSDDEQDEVLMDPEAEARKAEELGTEGEPPVEGTEEQIPPVTPPAEGGETPPAKVGLVDGRFKTPEELETAYSNLETAFSGKANFEEKYNALLLQQQQLQPGQPPKAPPAEGTLPGQPPPAEPPQMPTDMMDPEYHTKLQAYNDHRDSLLLTQVGNIVRAGPAIIQYDEFQRAHPSIPVPVIDEVAKYVDAHGLSGLEEAWPKYVQSLSGTDNGDGGGETPPPAPPKTQQEQTPPKTNAELAAAVNAAAEVPANLGDAPAAGATQTAAQRMEGMTDEEFDALPEAEQEKLLDSMT